MNELKESVKLIFIERGAGFTYGGYRWTKLADTPGGGTLAITTGLVCKRAFDTDGCNDWSKSGLRKWLNDDFQSELIEKGAKADDLMWIASDLTADDGMKDYGVAEDAIALLSCDLYRQHRDVIPPVDEWYWTLTPWTCNASNSRYVRLVDNSGTLNIINAYYGYWGVRPLFNLKSDILVSIAEPEAKIDTRKYTECSECCGAIGDKYWSHDDCGEDEAYCSKDCVCRALGVEDWYNTED